MERRRAIKRVGISIAGIVAAPAISNFLFGCSTKDAEKVVVQSKAFFNPKQDQMVAEISEIIIPTTNTPGAKEARVNEFIDVMLTDCYYEKDQQSFLEGLERMENSSKRKYNTPFLKASPEQKSTLLKQESIYNDNGPSRFFQLMKELTLFGYFTSEVGAVQALEYVPVPGKFKGCITLTEDQRAWAI